MYQTVEGIPRKREGNKVRQLPAWHDRAPYAWTTETTLIRSLFMPLIEETGLLVVEFRLTEGYAQVR